MGKKVLLDTNIVIHREGSSIINKEIGVLFRWLDKLNLEKWIHPITVQEFGKLKEGNTKQTITVKLDAYNLMQVPSQTNPFIARICGGIDVTDNDKNDTILLNELYNGRVDYFITEDKKILRKAGLLNIASRVFTIDGFLEKVVSENPELTEYKILAVRKEFFANVNVADEFFDSFRRDYPGFDAWFNKKSQEVAYVCRSDGKITAFLYLKIEDENESYNDINPVFTPKRRIKIGTFKVLQNGYKLGERFLKIIFDYAVHSKVEEIYVTIFNKTLEQQRLIYLLEEFGFVKHGVKLHQGVDEEVYTRDMRKIFNNQNPKISFPYFYRGSRAFLVPIYPEYHTNLFPDSILRTESPNDFIENEPFRNAISKVYISRSYFKDLQTGDNIVFYRTGGYHLSVVSTIGIVESVITNITSEVQFIEACRKRSVFDDKGLKDFWNYSPNNHPFIVNFLYTYSFPKRINMRRLIELGVIQSVGSAPRGFVRISQSQFNAIIKESETDESFVVD